jgi:hypothetical protein
VCVCVIVCRAETCPSDKFAPRVAKPCRYAISSRRETIWVPIDPRSLGLAVWAIRLDVLLLLLLVSFAPS